MLSKFDVPNHVVALATIVPTVCRPCYAFGPCLPRLRERKRTAGNVGMSSQIRFSSRRLSRRKAWMRFFSSSHSADRKPCLYAFCDAMDLPLSVVGPVDDF